MKEAVAAENGTNGVHKETTEEKKEENGEATKEAEAAPETTEAGDATTEETKETTEESTEEATKRKADAPSEDETSEKIAKLRELKKYGKKVQTEAPVVANVVASDILGEDDVADVAYAVDAGGAIYRLAFVTASGDVLSEASITDGDGDGVPDDWTMVKIAGTTASASDDLRFMNTPAVAAVSDVGKRYVFVALGAGDREKPLKTNYPYSDAITYKFYAVIDRLWEWDVPNDGVSTALALTSADRLIDMDDLAPAAGTANDTNTYGLF